MPTNVSTPIWRCDICGARFGEDHSAAQRCEDAGTPVVLPDGELLLVYHDYGQRFWLAGLEALARLGTRATAYNDQAGHYAVYHADTEAGHSSSSRPTYHSDELWPHDPTRHLLNVSLTGRHARHRRQFGRDYNYAGDRRVVGWPLRHAGLLVDEGRVGFARPAMAGTVRLVRPISAEVRAVFDLLQVQIAYPRGGGVYGFDRSGAQAVLAAEQTSRRDRLPDGVYDPNRAAWWLAQTPEEELIAEALDRQERWMAGEQVIAPRPRLHAILRRRGGHLSASKLTNADKAIINATGVPWPERTGADDYIRLLVNEKLEVIMTAVDDRMPTAAHQLFGGVSKRLAVTSSKGGVGKSTVASALGVALARLGERVLLVDLNLPNPAQHLIWRLGPVEVDLDRRLLHPTVAFTPSEGAGRLAVFSHAQLAPHGDPNQAMQLELAGEWLAFLGGVFDLAGSTPEQAFTTVIFDLPPGWDAVHQQVFDSSVVALTDCVHVTTGDPLAVETEFLPAQQQVRSERVTHWLVENLSRAQVTTADGVRVEGRLYGDTAAVMALADRAGVNYAGSLPWATPPTELARASEVVGLAARIQEAAS
jgi:Mrp family chromosome partitioning ATPase